MEFRRCSINGHVYGQGFTDVSADKAGVGEKEREELTQTRLKAMQQQMAGCVVNHLAHVTDTSFFDDTIFDRFRNNPSERAAIGAFFTVLAVCHTIPTPEPDSERKYKYNAQSPDESALVSCAHDMGFSFERRDLNRVYVDIHGSKECYEILHVLEFNSTRKRMSVVVRTEDGQVVLMTKGADSVICRRLAHGQDKKIDMTLAHLAEFAGEGLRTLCIAQRVISPEEFAAWSIIQQAASVSLVDRDRLLDESAERIEQNLVLLGATAIEDKLQEGVSTAIATLRSAGLKIWVLTGDKLETAINIGYASNLLSEEMTLLVVAGQTIDEISSQIGRALGHFVPATASSKQQPRRAADWFERINALRDQVLPSKATRAKRRMGIEKLVPIEPTIYGLVIDGDSLEFVLGSAPLRRMFLQLAVLCESIVCCRVSPKQKAQVVQLVQEGLGAMCLSIGDGANDVSMIQQAHIGIGISGKEGLQAALASDFVIGQFRFLSRLLMFHGHWAYYRISGSILNFFFKNMAWIMTMFWYQYYSGFTGIILYDYTYILLFNLIFTALPPLIIGVFDKDVSEARILTHPQIYQLGIRQFFFSYTKFFVYIIDAIYQAFISHYFALAIFGSEANRHGYASDRTILGTVAAMNTIVAINVSMLSNISSWSSIVVASMLLSAFSFIIFVPIASKVAKGSLLGVADELFTDVRLYLDLVVCTVACTLPRTALGLFRVMLAPTDMDVVREMRSSNSVVQDAQDAVAPTMWLTNRVNAIEMSDAPGTGPLQRRVSWAGAQHSVGNRAQFMEMAARPPPIVTGSDAQRRHVASSNFELASPQSTATLSMSPGGPNVRRVRSSMIHADSDRLPPREDSVIGRITAGRAPSPSRQSLRDGIPGTQIRFMGQSRSSLDEGQRRHTFDAYEGVADHHEQWTGFAFAADESAAARRMSFRLSMTSEQIASEMLGRTPSIRSASPTRSDDRSQSPVRGDVQPAMTPRMAMPISVAHAPAHVHNRPILQPQRSNPLMQSYLAHTPMSPAEAAPSQMRPAAPSTAQQQHPNQQHPPPPGL
nr:hypothetical protein HK105_002932 [Polyrhizophydium stewartii]